MFLFFCHPSLLPSELLLCHRFNKVLETFLRDFGQCWHDNITQLLQICDVNVLFHYLPKVHCWIETWWLWMPFVYRKVNILLKKPEVIWALWYSRCGHMEHGQQQYSGGLWHFNNVQFTNQTRKCFCTVLLSHFSEPLQTVPSWS